MSNGERMRGPSAGQVLAKRFMGASSLRGSDLWQRWAGSALLAVEVLLVAALGLMLARLAWLVVDPAGAVAPQAAHLRMRNADTAQRGAIGADVSRLLSDTPFAPSEAAAGPAPDAPPTQLNLVLKGVRAAGTSGDGMAVISASGDPAKRFGPGEELLPGVFLDGVFADRVTLRQNGAIESLFLEGTTGKLSVLDLPPPPKSADITPAASAALGPVLPAALLSALMIEPVNDGVNKAGRVSGYRLKLAAANADFTAAGLANGDIIVALDGAPVADFDPADLADRFSGRAAVRLKIKRDGKFIERVLTPQGSSQP
jgi:general secretion pathway protein C